MCSCGPPSDHARAHRRPVGRCRSRDRRSSGGLPFRIASRNASWNWPNRAGCALGVARDTESDGRVSGVGSPASPDVGQARDRRRAPRARHPAVTAFAIAVLTSITFAQSAAGGARAPHGARVRAVVRPRMRCGVRGGAATGILVASSLGPVPALLGFGRSRNGRMAHPGNVVRRHRRRWSGGCWTARRAPVTMFGRGCASSPSESGDAARSGPRRRVPGHDAADTSGVSSSYPSARGSGRLDGVAAAEIRLGRDAPRHRQAQGSG